MESEMIEGYEFPLLPTPVREQPKPHVCVCLLVEEIEGEDNAVRTITDKCAQKIENPDQAFCDHCEACDHHLSDIQFGLKGKGA
jgi:hypothetical protein